MSEIDWREKVGDEAMPLGFQQAGELPAAPLPGHPVLEGAGYDCHCGACLAQPGYEPRQAAL